VNLYVESSAALRAILGGDDDDQIRDLLAAEHPVVVTSRLTLAEVARVMARLRVARSADADRATTREAVILHAADLWLIHPVDEEVLRRCGRPFPVEPVRTLDAIHLATIERLARAVTPLTVLSTDDRVRRNAESLGFDVLP